jgi:hypothetical protein
MATYFEYFQFLIVYLVSFFDHHNYYLSIVEYLKDFTNSFLILKYFFLIFLVFIFYQYLNFCNQISIHILGFLKNLSISKIFHQP